MRAIIIDADMPGLNWGSALSSVRELHPPISLIVLGAPSRELSVKALMEGADFYLDKPFSQRELIARLNALLRRYGG